MRKPTLIRKLAAGLTLALIATSAFAAPPRPFTATYQVLSGDQLQGEATIKLSPDGNGEFTYSNQSKGTTGMAAALHASSSETTRFRWVNGMPETLRYDSVQIALKTKQRHLIVNPATHEVSVDEGKGVSSYTGTPGMVDRNTLPLALGLALLAGKQEVTLPVGVRQNVEQQQYRVAGSETVQVPAGSFKAERVERSNADKPFSGWYVPQKFPMPVKLSQADGGNLTLELVKFSQS